MLIKIEQSLKGEREEVEGTGLAIAKLSAILQSTIQPTLLPWVLYATFLIFVYFFHCFSGDKSLKGSC
ncbi:MAG: hypothetical protein mread185_000258 [Mycoplasmataceae bacterium]|nr:MAG: hypothetical protein mread185_000258 [Mycoplasmataceae bacterium]